jgi:hypothetical protein
MKGLGTKINKNRFVIVPICCHCIVGVVLLFQKWGENHDKTGGELLLKKTLKGKS